MIKKKKAVRKLSAFFLACTCLVTSVYTPYPGLGGHTVYAQDLAELESQPVLVQEDGAQPQQNAVTDYLYFGRDGQQIGEALNDTSNPPQDYAGYIERKVAGSEVTVTPHAAEGYEFAMLNLISKETDSGESDNKIYTPLSRNYVKDGGSGKEIAEGEIPSYTFMLNEEGTYDIGASYTVMPDVEVYFDSTDGKLNTDLNDMMYEYQYIGTGDKNESDGERIKKWLTGKISAGASTQWNGGDIQRNNSCIIFDAGEKSIFEITDIISYGRFDFESRFRFRVEISDNGADYTTIAEHPGGLATANDNKKNRPYTNRAQVASGNKWTGRYLRLQARTNNTDISHLAIYGQKVSSCAKLNELKNVLEQYEAAYNSGTNNAGYDTALWETFTAAYRSAQVLADSHDASGSCGEEEDAQLKQAETALEEAYQALLASKTSITYQIFKNGTLQETVDSLDNIGHQEYDGYVQVKVVAAEDGTKATLTPTAAAGREFSLLTLEAYDSSNQLLRSYSALSKDYKKQAGSADGMVSEQIIDGQYGLELELTGTDGGTASLQFASLPAIRAYFDREGPLSGMAVKTSHNSMETVVSGKIHAGGRSWSGKDFRKADDSDAIFYAGDGKQFTINSVVIYGRTSYANNRFSGLVLETSNDGENFTELLTTKNYESSRAWETPREEYTRPVYSRYLRIRNAKSADILNISLVKFYGVIEDDKTDYYALQQACEDAKVIDEAGQVSEGKWNYTDDTWQAFQTAYQQAKELLAKWDNENENNPSGEDTANAAKILSEAIQDLAEGLPTFINQTGGQLKHPAVGNSAEDLQRLRSHVIAGEEPWASYFEEFSKSEYASPNYVIRNDASPESETLTPKKGYADYGNNLFNGDMMYDAKAAYYQAVMYYMTGDVEYRAKAMRILRIWSKLNPAEAFYANDAHIHHATPVYYFNCAAELLRYTSTNRTDLVWTQNDTDNYINNYLTPPLDPVNGWFIDHTKWFNQHQTVLMARLSSMIFMDNKAGYEETVEWVTVNSKAKAAGGDIAYRNGAIENAYPLLTVKGEVTENGYVTTNVTPYVAIAEMVRDQPHAGENMTNMMYCARMLMAQGTKVDPTAGTVSSGSDAVDIYSFLDDRLIKGVNYWCQYNLGYEDMIFFDKKDGVLSDFSRGRIWNIIDFYMHYKYVKNYQDSDDNFKYVAEEYQYIRDTFGNYRDESWMYIPDGALNQAETAKAAKNPVSAKQYEFEEQAHWDKGTAGIEKTAAGLKVTASETGTTFAMLHLYDTRTGKLEIKYKSNGVSVMDISRYRDSSAVMSIVLPDTKGQLKSIVFDPTVVGAYIDNKIFYYHVRGSESTEAEFDSMLINTKTNPAIYEGGRQERLIYVYPGMALSSANAVGDTGYSYELQGNVPEGLKVSDGSLSWNVPGDLEPGITYECYLVAEKDSVLSVLKLNLSVVSDYQALVDSLAAEFDETAVYESATKEAFEKAYQEAKAVTDGDSLKENAAVLALEEAAAGLRLLNPLLFDGTFDYTDRVSLFYGNKDNEALTTTDRRPLLTDNDFDTYSSDVWDKHERSIIYDFGEQFRFRADAFQFAPRTAQTGRTARITIFGSNDAKSWVALTDESVSSDDYQTVEVYPEQRNQMYRYIMTKQLPVASGHPMSYSEFRMDGERIELEKMISDISIASDDRVTGNYTSNGNNYTPVAYRADTGKTITLTFEARRELSGLNVTIEGQAAQVAHNGSDDSYSYTASVTLASVSGEPHDADFLIQYQKEDGTQSEPIQVTSDGSCVLVSNQYNLISDVMAKATSIASEKPAEAADMFDNNMGTWPDLGVHDPVTLDFGDNQIQLERIEILPRFDFNRRLMKFYVEASVDGINWRNITKTYWDVKTSWTSLSVFPYDQSKSYRYLRLRGSSWYGNIAEARLYGKCGQNLEENLRTYTVTASPNEEGAGECKVYLSGQSSDSAVSSLSGIKGGDIVMLKAVPASGYRFKNWIQKKEFCGVAYDYTFTKESSSDAETTIHYSQGDYQGSQWYNEVIADMDVIAVFEKTTQEPDVGEEPGTGENPGSGSGAGENPGSGSGADENSGNDSSSSSGSGSGSGSGSSSGSSSQGSGYPAGTPSSGTSSGLGNRPISGTDSDNSSQDPLPQQPVNSLPENKVIIAETENTDGTFTDANGETIKNAIVEAPDGHKYITDAEGRKRISGFVDTLDGTTYYVKDTGIVAEKEIIKSDGEKYFAKETGAIAKNEFCTTVKGSTVYAAADGTLAADRVITVAGKKYFAKKSCAIAKNGFFTTPSGNQVYAGKSGVLKVDRIFTVKSKKYYAKKSGAIARGGFYRIAAGKRVYAKKSGVLAVNGIFKVNGKKYYAKKSGIIVTKKWVKAGNRRYYCNASGRITKTKK